MFGQLGVGGFAWNIAVGNFEGRLERELRIPWMESSGCPVKAFKDPKIQQNSPSVSRSFLGDADKDESCSLF